MERERDIGRSLTAAQDTFVAMAINLVTHRRDDIFDIQHPETWYKAYNKYVYTKFPAEREVMLIGAGQVSIRDEGPGNPFGSRPGRRRQSM